MSLLERFELSNRLLGHPHIVTYVVQLTTAATGRLSPTTLGQRISLLQQHFPMLWAEVNGTDTSKPYFKAREQGMWHPDDVLRIEKLEAIDVKDLDGDVSSKILKREQDRMTAKRMRRDTPPFQFTLYTYTPEQSPDVASSTYLTLSVEHTHMDGTGALRLLLLSLHDAESDTILNLPYEKLHTIPQYEATVKTRPTLSHLIPIAYQELVLPSLPLAIQRLLGKSADLWPDKRIKTPLADASWTLCTGRIPAEEVEALKLLGKKLGIKTLHPIFHCLYLVAVWAITHQEAEDAQPVPSNEPFSIGTGVAISERDPLGKGHAYCTGIFISDLEYQTSLQPNVHFWSLVRDLASVLGSESGKRRARGTIGLLKHIPNKIVKGKEGDRTGWEVYLEEKMSSETPVRIALAVSNLGNVDNGIGMSTSLIKLPENTITDIQWTQTPTPFVAPIMVNLIGFGGCMVWNTTFRDGSVVDASQVRRINRLVEGMARRLALSKTQDSQETLAISTLVADMN